MDDLSVMDKLMAPTVVRSQDAYGAGTPVSRTWEGKLIQDLFPNPYASVKSCQRKGEN